VPNSASVEWPRVESNHRTQIRRSSSPARQTEMPATRHIPRAATKCSYLRGSETSLYAHAHAQLLDEARSISVVPPRRDAREALFPGPAGQIPSTTRTSCARERRPSLRYAFPRWNSTVFGLRKRCGVPKFGARPPRDARFAGRTLVLAPHTPILQTPLLAAPAISNRPPDGATVGGGRRGRPGSKFGYPLAAWSACSTGVFPDPPVRPSRGVLISGFAPRIAPRRAVLGVEEPSASGEREGCANRVSCGEVVFVDEAAESLVPLDRGAG
jgi:hypothetical protein